MRTSANTTSSSSSVGPVLASPSPDFLGKLSTFGFRCLVNDPPAFVVCASLVGQSRLDILGEIARAGIVLARAPSLACPGRSDSKACVTALAEPAEIIRRAVRLVAVLVVYYQEASRAAQSTLSGSGRAALGLVRMIPLCPVGYRIGRLSPARAAFRRPCYSSPESSSSSEARSEIS